MKHKFHYLISALFTLGMMLVPEGIIAQCVPGKTISLYGGGTSIDICATTKIRLHPGSGGPNVFAITNPEGIIEAIETKNVIDLGNLSAGNKRIYGVSWWGTLHNPVGEDIMTAEFADFCYELSANFIEVNIAGGSTGTITPTVADVCLEGDQASLMAEHTNFEVGSGYELIYVLTSGDDLVIQNVNASPSFDVTSAGTYTIHPLFYDPATLDLGIVEIGVTTGFDVNGLLRQGGGEICAVLDVAGAKFSVNSPSAGSLTAQQSSICYEEDGTTLTAEVAESPIVPEGYASLYVLTSGEGLTIEQVGADPTFDVEGSGIYTIHTLVYDPNTLDLSIVEFGVTTGVDVNGLLSQGGGTICASLDVAGARFSVDNPMAGTLLPVDAIIGCETTATLSASTEQAPSVPDGYSVLYVLTSGDELTIQNVSAEPTFDVSAGGLYTIHTLVYDPETLDLGIVEVGVTTGVDVNGLLRQGGGEICAALDVAGAKFNVNSPSAGSLTAQQASICYEEGGTTLIAEVVESPTVPEGYASLYVLTSGEGLTIEQVGADPTFDVEGSGIYTIHTLVYDPNTLDLGIVEFGVTTGVDVNGLLIQGGGTICASLDVAGARFSIDNPMAGTLLPVDTTIGCVATATLSASTDQAPSVPDGYSVLYVLTSGDELTIQNVNAEPTFEVSAGGLYTIHTLVYDPETLDLGIVEVGVTTGVDVNGLLRQGGGEICAALDVAGAKFNVNSPSAGSLQSDHANLCFEDDSITISAIHASEPVAPAGFSIIYVLTSGDDLVIQNVSADPSFDVDETGIYTIHTLVYDPATLDLGIVEVGVTTGVDVNGLLVQGGGSICAALDVPGARFELASPDAGTLSATASEICYAGSPVMLEATTQTAPSVPSGYETIYVLTRGSELTIQNVNSAPSFEVEDAGWYTIHTLVYDPNTLDLGIVEIGVTTGVDVNGLLTQGGGSICASLDVAGATFSVGPGAGTLSPTATEGCEESFVIAAEHVDMPYVPEGYSTLYVLTSGPTLVIEQVSADPSFTVDTTGMFTIHTLVYDTATLDLGIVQIGVTTGVDVNGLLVQGGGDVCAALDVAGAVFMVAAPSAGTLSASATFVCFDGTSSLLEATVDQAPTVPMGYSSLYVLTQGDDLVIRQVGAAPSFTVDVAGTYTIHTLVYDSTTLDLSIVEIGATTGVDVNGLLVQGGGSICAALDVSGAAFTTGPSAGTLTADQSSPSLAGGDSTTISASVDQEPFVPSGYSVLYVLTSGEGLIIENVSDSPSFSVTSEGRYTIHTLVYDPTTLDLSIVEIGVTTGVDVNGLLVQGGGAVCAALDVAGASFEAAVGATARAQTLEIERVWHDGYQIRAIVHSDATLDAPIQINHLSGLPLYQDVQTFFRGTNTLEITLPMEVPSTLYFVRIGSETHKIVKNW